MSKLLARLALAAALGLSASSARAASVSADLAVSANVANKCTVSTTSVGFGAYDPVVTNAVAGTNDLNGTGAVVVACTKGTSYTVTLGTGANSTVVGTDTIRRMSAGTEFLEYELYTSAARDTVWNTSTTPALPAAASKAPVTITVYGQVKGGQDVAAGVYSDLVSATVNY